MEISESFGMLRMFVTFCGDHAFLDRLLSSTLLSFALFPSLIVDVLEMVVEGLNICVVDLFEDRIVFSRIEQPLQTDLLLFCILLYQNEVWDLDVLQSLLRFVTPKEIDK